MKKITFLSSTLATAMLSSSAIADDYHALIVVQMAPVPTQDKELSAIEGGATCNNYGAVSGGGVALCAWVV